MVNMIDTKEFPVLYVLMRNDLASMNNGKASAQASHAGNAFDKLMLEEFGCSNTETSVAYWPRLYHKWKNETTQGFGTVLTLAVNEIQMRTAVDIAHKFGVPATIIHDPTYPLVDGDFVHFLPLDTCAVIFGDKKYVGQLVNKFPLHP